VAGRVSGPRGVRGCWEAVEEVVKMVAQLLRRLVERLLAVQSDSACGNRTL
jgi:hypothetical protein